MATPVRPADKWGPQYFLAALGAGGLAVTFFMWLYMWVPHPNQPVPVYEDIAAAFAKGNSLQQAMIVIAALGIAGFALLHFRGLIWNLRNLSAFRKTEAYARLRASNMESQMLGLPLALAMAINVGFVLGMVFVPGLWNVVEYLFPAALAAFAAVGVLALKQLGAYLGRITRKGGFDWAANGSFAQVQPAFALGMIGVGMSAPAALSLNPVTSGVAIILATVFLVLALVYATIGVILGIASMLQNGVAPEGVPTLMNIVPLTTVLGILVMRINHGLHVHFGVHSAPGDDLSLLTRFIAVQLAFGLFGLVVLKSTGYMARFVNGPENSPGSYGLICPGVAVSVMLQFWINKALVPSGLIEKFGTGYWALSAVAVAFQLGMVVLLFRLNRRHFRAAPQSRGVPAE